MKDKLKEAENSILAGCFPLTDIKKFNFIFDFSIFLSLYYIHSFIYGEFLSLCFLGHMYVSLTLYGFIKFFSSIS